ncbi:GntR family transcriptional regulator [Hoeflea alexandrii]|uniref:GntR family transcriptional regulator n=1 Tax=Hoeflea alexandrii TaxID=288436 RepID=UPI0022708B7D|nr:GntR family transcriptional regulator [Hoeflea alexandrii]MCY0153756.1 GntR family transcriptional regulator [Hoeflea alexandrii]
MTKALRTVQGEAHGQAGPASRSDMVVVGLQRAIFEHKIAPGTKLSEDEVGEIFGVSRTIVRSALQALAHSQLVSIEKNRGAFIASPTPKEAHEVFEARGLIEPRVAAMAAKRMTDQMLEILASHIEDEHAATASGDKGRALSLSGGYHLKIAEIAGHEVFTDFIRALISRSSLIIALYWRRADTTCESHSHHALMKAFEHRDPAAAEEIMRSHIVDLHSGLNLSDVNRSPLSLADALKL